MAIVFIFHLNHFLLVGLPIILIKNAINWDYVINTFPIYLLFNGDPLMKNQKKIAYQLLMY